MPWGELPTHPRCEIACRAITHFSPRVPDRLKELQQQRALVEQQLAWLDREIAAARGHDGPDTTRPAIAPRMTTTAARSPELISRGSTTTDLAAEEIMAQYQQEARSLQSSVKRGCYLYFFLALGIAGLGVFALYYFKTRS